MPRNYISKKTGKAKVYQDKVPKKKAGRPSKFNKDLEAHAITLSQIGMVNTDIARELDIPITTFDTWLKKFPKFSDNLDENRNKMILESQKCLMKRVQGFSYKEKKVTESKILVYDEETKKDKRVGARKIKTTVIEKEILPDVQAAQFILDRRSKYFRRKPEDTITEAKEETFNVYVNEITEPRK